MVDLLQGVRAQTEFCAEYKHGGSTWGLNFFAVDEADAAAKLQSIKTNLTLLGRLEARISADSDSEA